MSFKLSNGFFLVQLAVLLCVASCDLDSADRPKAPLSEGAQLRGVVVDYVKDGDSFTAKFEGRKIEVRLYGIDAPERQQPYSKQSRQAAVTLLGNSPLLLVVKDEDRYQRVVAEVFGPGSKVSVNEQLVQQGAAWVYHKYTDSPSLIEAERRARKRRAGIWSLSKSDQIEPWTWRKKNSK